MKEDIEKIKKIIEKFFSKRDNKIMFVCLVAIIIIPIIKLNIEATLPCPKG